ncbi:beta-ketoacyl synthase N-terminal-like domain-containing protein [Gemmatimonadota bacterium DH-20]|uniref:Beta-ketoacyl synthase N-terminal-like domain-containing protein n=1 Tax=Gaopeijia maritima TaxID=3119007 RepID=A0ABU9E9Z5_9BACT
MIDPRGLSATRLALLGRELWAERGRVQAAEPLAVVGYACRVPGADDPEAFWRLLLEGRDEVSEVPPDRWDAEAWYDPDPATPGRASSRWGGFLREVRGFDAAFFGISPSEAERMDPQQRLALEVTWEALERSGLPTDRLAGSATGVYFAAYHDDYARMQYARPESITSRTLTGTQHSVLANRISFLLGLHGPSLAVDTACSSSLVAVHLARRALLDRDCDLAIAGGVSLMLDPPMTVALSKGGFMSPTGRCHTFDAGADGFVRGEGCGVVVLRRLSDAIERGERVLAVVRGSAVNQDGISSTLSAPNGTAQAALIRRALDEAGLAPDRVSLLEAHGTGTRLGDPIETDALAEVFASTERTDPLWLGSVKANFGHLEAAAGVTGLIKAILCLRHRTVVPQPLYHTRNPLVDLSGTPMRIPEAVEPWSPAGPRVAGVSSFGVGGTNGHVLLEEAPAGLDPAASNEAGGPLVLPLSAASAAALAARVGQVAERLDEGVPAARLCRAAARGRAHQRRFRRAFAAADADALRAALESGARGAVEADGSPPLAFAYSGQGTQWARMGLDLAAGEPVFRDALGRVHEAVLDRGGPNLIEELERTDERSRLHRTDVAQVGIFAVQVALTELLRSWGVRADAVVGHSVGEVAAAWSSGHLDFESAVAAVVARATTMQDHAGPGAMLWLGAGPDRAAALAGDRGLVIAAVNGPASTVIAGDASAVADAADLAASEGIRARTLGVEYAFHSPAMEEAASRLRSEGPAVVAGSGHGRWYSSVHAAPVESLRSDWLADNVRSPVRFADAVAAMAGDGFRHFVEIGPHPALGSDLVSTLLERGTEARIACAMHRRRDPVVEPRALVATLYEWGVDPDWEALAPGPVDVEGLPTYPWQRVDYWLPEPETGASARGTGPADSRAGRLPGVPLDSPAIDGWAWELDPAHPSLAPLLDHRIDGEPRMPATALAELCRAAGLGAGVDDPEVLDLVVLAPVALRPGAVIQALVSADRRECRLVQRDDSGRWQTVARADFGPSSGDAREPWPAPEDRDAADPWEPEGGALLDFGPAFSRLRDVRVARDRAEGSVAPGSGWPGPVDPAAVDAAAQLCVPLLADRDGLFLPFSLGRYRVFAPVPDGPLFARVRRAAQAAPDTPGFDVLLEDSDGHPLVEILGWRMRRHRGGSAALAPEWRAASLPEPTRLSAEGRWLVVGGGEVADAVADRLSAAGAESVARDLAAEGALTVRGVVLCAALEGPEREGDSAPAPDPDRHWRWAELMRGCAGLESADAPVLVVTRGAQAPGPAGRNVDPAGGIALGLARALRSERPDLRVRTVDLDAAPSAVDAGILADRLLAEIAAAEPGDGVEVALRLEGRRVTRPGELRSTGPVERPSQPVRLHQASGGRLDRFEVIAADDPAPGPGEVALHVEAAGVNFRDVLSALGMVDGSPDAGQECAGRVVAVGQGVRSVAVGDRVAAFHPGSFGTRLVLEEGALWPLPSGVDPVGAATLPVTFGTAWVALFELGGLQAGGAVLIHGGAGGVGMAAVRLALRRGATVFATAGSPARRARLEALGVAGAFDSRSTDFEGDVRAATDGEGVDLVINSLTGEAIPAGLRCLRPGGRFIELGKRELLDDAGVRAVRSDVGYRAFDLRTMVDADPGLSRRLSDALAEGLSDGSLTPLPAAVFSLSDAGDAYRRMSRGDHLGKLVLRPTAPAPDPGAAGWAVVAGGSGAIGRSTVRWLLSQGRERIAVLSRSGMPDDDALRGQAAEAGAELRSDAVDLADAEALGAVLAELRRSAPITFVVHAAGVVHDGVLSGLDRADFEAVAAPKVLGSWHLHEATRDDPVEAFLLFSAAGPWMDAAGLAAYAAANGWVEALALHRRGLGLPATALVWGPWDGGMAGRLDPQHRRRWSERGAEVWDEPGGWRVLADALTTEAPTLLAVRGVSAARASARPASPAAGDLPELQAALVGVPPEDRRAVAMEHVAAVLQRLLGRPSVDPDMPLRDLGLDSLGAIELRNTLTRSSGTPLPATVAFDHPTVRALATRLVADHEPDAETHPEEAVPSGPDVDAIAALDDDVALNLLLQELDGLG